MAWYTGEMTRSTIPYPLGDDADSLGALRQRLWTAIRIQDPDAVKMVLNETTPVDPRVFWNWDSYHGDEAQPADPLLHKAAKGFSVRSATIVQLLLQAGADPNERDARDNTALHWAADGNNPGAMDALLQAGATVDHRNKDQETPLIRLGKRSSVAATLLLQAGADPNAMDTAGWTPLTNAVLDNDLDRVAVLLAAGAAPGGQQRDKERSPVIVAGNNKRRAVLNALFKAGADVSQVNFQDLTGDGLARWSAWPQGAPGLVYGQR